MDVSIIIATYNNANTVVKAVENITEEISLLPVKGEIIIADDGSNNENVSSMLDCLSTSYNPNIECKFTWQKDDNFRVGLSRNNGIKQSNGDVLIFIDGDCIPENNFVKSHLDFHSINQNSVSIGKRCFYPDKKSENYTAEYSLCKKAQENEDYTINYRSKSKNAWSALLARNFSIKKQTPMVYFDHRMYGWGGEDLGYAIALKNNGVDQFIYNPSAIVSHYGAPQSGDPVINEDPIKAAHTIINHLLLMKENENDISTYRELAKYLKYYSTPFDFFQSQHSMFMEDKKQEAIKSFSLELKKEEALSVYQSAKNQIFNYSKENNEIRLHPCYDYIWSSPENLSN
jgi:glycosyltransferase involved in cell wall biosynthesis